MNRNMPSIKALSSVVYRHGQWLRANFSPADLRGHGEDEDSPGYGDVRLQVSGDGWSFHTGSADYDQDHRGAWGSGSVPRGCTRAQARTIAAELIEDAAESMADALTE